MRTFTSKFIFAFLFFTFLLFALFYTNQLKAQNRDNPFTGVCGGVFNVGTIYDALWEFSDSSIDDESGSALVSINFDTSTLDISIQKLIVYNQDDSTKSPTQLGIGLNRPANGAIYGKRRDLEVESRIPFTLEAFPGVNGAFKINLGSDSTSETSMLVMPVNNGSTFLIQGITFGAAGVCQRV